MKSVSKKVDEEYDGVFRGIFFAILIVAIAYLFKISVDCGPGISRTYEGPVKVHMIIR